MPANTVKSDEQPIGEQSVDEQSIDDINLADEIAAITNRQGRSAEALTFYLLTLTEETQNSPDALRERIIRSVEFAFLYTDAYQVALELYIREKRGLIYGGDTAASLIQKVLSTNSQSPDSA